ncbi:MAG: ACP S-malonyltransferase [Frankiales bacterium]|nr:ACP S-malonyltransferase [Frankiales bacterium]
MLAVLCPGQGSQSAGFLRPWLAVDGVASTLDRLSTYAGFDLVATGTDKAADVVDTAVAQPLLVAVGIATARLLPALPIGTVVAGHSVGELTGAAVAGAMTAQTAMTAASARGRAMGAAAAATSSGMAAVLGGDEPAVAASAEAAGCWVANHNGAGQLVVAGTLDALDRFAATAPPGARVRRLPVAGAFHTPLMAPAATTVADVLRTLPRQPLGYGVVSNADGRLVTDPEQLTQRLAQQVTRPVRFDECLRTLRTLGVTATIELAPGGVLTNVVRRQLPDVQAVAIKTPDDVEVARDVVASFAPLGEPWAEPWQLVVAPAGGTLRLAADGSATRDVAVVANRSGDVPVQFDRTVSVVEWLAHDGDPVREGQPLARLASAAR